MEIFVERIGDNMDKKYNISKIKIDLTSIINSWENVSDVLNRFKDELSHETSKIGKIVETINENLPQTFRDINIKLSNRGWYIIVDMDLNNIIDIQEKSGTELDDLMVLHARKLINKTLIKVEKYYPERYQIVKDSIDAHSSQLFTLCIPVFLAQSDGIASELFGVNLFSIDYKTHEPKTKGKRLNILEENSELLEAIFLFPLDNITNFNSKKKMEGVLNRNLVLHGIDTKYQTEINSLKCIVLLNYLLDITEIYFKNV